MITVGLKAPGPTGPGISTRRADRVRQEWEGVRMAEIGLSEAIGAVRAELAAAVEQGVDAELQFPVSGVQLEFHVAVTKKGEGRAGVRFYVVELGGAGSYAREEIQTVIVTLGAPVDRAGEVVKVTRRSRQKP